MTIAAEELGGNWNDEITYAYLSDINITVGKKSYSLEEAIRDGHISVEEIIAYAQIDARNGICREMYTTYHSLTQFIYRYPEFDLRVTHDVFLSPDGTEHLIRDLLICPAEVGTGFGYTDEETGESIAREDWGIQFEVIKSTSTGLTLEVRQAGGYQIGTLYLQAFSIDRRSETYEPLKKLDGTYLNAAIEPNIPIEDGDVTEVSLHWDQEYGPLSSGSYTLFLTVQDVFDEETVHPLMEDFTDSQHYQIPFTIS